MIIKTFFLAGLMLASALASKNEPFPAALLVQSNFDFSLTRKEFRVHYGGPKDKSVTPEQVFIKLYGPDKTQALSYELKEEKERKTSQAIHFALDTVEDGKYEVEVCEGSTCSARTPSLTDVAKIGEHTLSCEPINSSEQDIEVKFLEPTDRDWAIDSDYSTFSAKINAARSASKSAGTEDYETDYEKLGMNANPFFSKQQKIFHTAMMYNLRHYKDFFDKTKVNEYCGRKNMLSLHSHVVDKITRKVIYRFKTVNHLSEGGKDLFIRSDVGGKILLESTHKNVVIPAGSYEVWVSLCVTNKDTIESTYCANPITKDLTVKDD